MTGIPATSIQRSVGGSGPTRGGAARLGSLLAAVMGRHPVGRCLVRGHLVGRHLARERVGVMPTFPDSLAVLDTDMETFAS